MPTVATCIWSFYRTQLFPLFLFPTVSKPPRRLFQRPDHHKFICGSSAHSSAFDLTAATIFRLARALSRVLASPNTPRFVIYRGSKLLHQPKKSLYNSPSAIRRCWTLSLSDGIFDTLLKITTKAYDQFSRIHGNGDMATTEEGMDARSESAVTVPGDRTALVEKLTG